MAVDQILVNGVTEILKNLSSVLTNEITLVWAFKDELKNLQTTLNMILAVMEDAEKKQVSSETVRLWMEELKSIAYDANDILDEYSYEIIMCKHKKEDKSITVLNKVRNVFSNSISSFVCSWKLAHKIKKINEKFNKIAKRKNDLGLQTLIDVSGSSSSTMMMENRETYSLVAANWKIVGRENDKSKIINMVLDKDSCLVLSMVGMGGMGKTTMAQLVYNDEVVRNHFQLKIWICVSDPFDVKKLFKNIANSTKTCEKYDDTATMDDIVHGLQDAFRGKKFLLVLDDVWNENPEDWYKFKTPFMVGAEGSKILVTTRSMDVASIMMDKFPYYELGILNDNDSWSLFKEIAFGSAAGAVETPKLVEIGETMVKRCGGLPLALVFLGSLMRSRKKEEEWKNIRDTKIWHESHEGKKSKHRILPSLRLSYEYLPSHLKQCFSYCCLFPKDWEIRRETLIQLWMAEGFLIESSRENEMSMEEIGNEYFHNLLSNFFFQDAERNRNGDIVACKMHDVVHDLARSVVRKKECLMVENAHDIDRISEETLRLSLVNVDEELVPKISEALKNAKNLRTVLVDFPRLTYEEEGLFFYLEKAFNKNLRLRVLYLRGYIKPRARPTCISISLKHLRYLHLPETCIIPKGIGRLRFLQTLNEFNLGDDYTKNGGVAGGIEELEGLNHLRGDLTIRSLQNVTSGTAACRANLKEKKNLRRLNLIWFMRQAGQLHDQYANDEAVLEGLRPHPNLRTLTIEGFQGAKLPSWMEDSSCLPNLVELGFTQSYMMKLKSIGNELYNSAADGTGTGTGSGSSSTTTIAFPSLKKLTLYMMFSLNEWVVPAPNCFPLLEEINIMSCSRLTTITPTTTIFPSLKVLNFNRMDGGVAKTLVTNNLNSLTSLSLSWISNLVSLPHQGLMENNNTLLSLSIRSCHQFKGFLRRLPNKEDEDDLQQMLFYFSSKKSSQIVSSSSCSSSSLQSLTLYDCPAMRFFLYPNIRSLTSLRALKIQSCIEPSSLQKELTCVSSSSSSLEHLEHVQISRNCIATTTGQQEVLFEWRKSS